MCIEFLILEVNVPVKFSGTGGFPLRRDGRYLGIYFSYKGVYDILCCGVKVGMSSISK